MAAAVGETSLAPRGAAEWRNFTPPVISSSPDRWNFHEGNPYGIQVAVVGMGIMGPSGNNVPEFVNNVINGKRVIEKKGFPEMPWLPELLVGEIRDFNPRKDLQGIILREHLPTYSRAQQIELKPTFEALQQAGLLEPYMKEMGLRGEIPLWRINEGIVNPTRVAVVYGTGIGGAVGASVAAYKEIQPREINGRMWGDMPKQNHVLEALPARGGPAVSMAFNAQGEMKTVLAECATGNESLQAGLDILRLDRADVVIVVNSEAAMEPVGVSLFSTLGVVSSDDPAHSPRAFDEGNSGFAFSEAAAVMVLEKLDHARARSADVLAIFAGAGAAADAHHATSPRQDGRNAIDAMMKAVRDTGGPLPHTDIYVNAHATGTPRPRNQGEGALGADEIEGNVIFHCLGEHTGRLRTSSTKTNTGHMLGAATLGEAVISISAVFEHGVLPPTLNSHFPVPVGERIGLVRNEAIDGRDTGIIVDNGFGFGGHDASTAFFHRDLVNY